MEFVSRLRERYAVAELGVAVYRGSGKEDVDLERQLLEDMRQAVVSLAWKLEEVGDANWTEWDKEFVEDLKRAVPRMLRKR